MKKYLIIFILTLIALSSFSGAISENVSYKLNRKTNTTNESTADPTHIVFAEYATTTWCPSCPTASEAMYSIYQSGDYPFYYVSIVSDMNKIAEQRSRRYHNIVIPSVYLDGGDLNYFGNAGSVQATEDVYRSLIEESGIRDVARPIDINMTVIWNGDAEITVTVDIKNNGNSFYFGILRIYVTEIESRWNDQKGDPYHFGFLDFAINRLIFLFPQKTKTISTTWDGKENHAGLTFEDITEDNIMVISTVSHWIPHLRQGYQDPPKYNQKYFAFFVDQTAGAMPDSN